MKASIFIAFALSCIALSTSTKTPIKPAGTICGQKPDGTRKTFKTKCAMYTYNYKEETNYSYVSDGPCCAVRCNLDVYEPICAVDLKGVRRTFTSQCQLSSLICNEGIDFKYVSDGPCCAVKCPLFFRPFCAINSRGEKHTFGNSCELAASKCSHGEDYTYLMDGPCSKDCDFACASIYKPVWAVNSEGEKLTFSNACEMDRHNCVNCDDFKDDNTPCVE